MKADTFVLMHSTVPGAREAEHVADCLVNEGLAACVQTAPIRSTYRWKGHVEKDDEVLLLIKTRAALAQAVTARILELHTYEVPEVVMLPLTGGSDGYLRWLADATSTGCD